MPWRYVVAILAFAMFWALTARVFHISGIGYLLVTLFASCGVALAVERRFRG